MMLKGTEAILAARTLFGEPIEEDDTSAVFIAREGTDGHEHIMTGTLEFKCKLNPGEPGSDWSVTVSKTP